MLQTKIRTQKDSNALFFIAVLFISGIFVNILVSDVIIDSIHISRVSINDLTNLGTIQSSQPNIAVDGNTQLVSVVDGGTGVKGDPYIIKDRIIDAGGNGSAISIKNINAYLVIKDCTVFNGGNTFRDAGISLISCRNVELSRNNASFNAYQGIFVEVSSAINISGNLASNNGYYGICLLTTNNNVISSNNASYNAQDGIRTIYCTKITIHTNFVSYNRRYGIEPIYSHYSNISRNQLIRNNLAGLSFLASNHSVISENVALYGNSSGFSLNSVGASKSYNNSICNNVAVYNKGAGIYLWEFNNSRIIANNISYNGGRSFSIYNSSFTQIYHNTIEGNLFQIPSYIQSRNISWDNGSLGNYWGDYTLRYPSAGNDGVVWNITYAISGTESDRYPLVSPFGSCGTIINMPPVITSPGSITFYANGTGRSLSWTVTDATTKFPLTYQILRNGTQIYSGTWMSGSPVTISLGCMPVGTYGYMISVQDGLGGTASDSVIVRVLNVAPDISAPADITYVYGDRENYITWSIVDESYCSATFVVYREGLPVTNGCWEDGISIFLNIDYLPVGIYNYTLVALDGFNGTAYDMVIVKVQNVQPSITFPADLSIIQGSTGNSISWIPADSSIASTTYLIYRDGVLTDSGTWVSEIPVTFNIDNLPPGSHNITIMIDDGLGGIVQDSVFVAIYTGSPTIIDIANPATMIGVLLTVACIVVVIRYKKHTGRVRRQPQFI